MKREKPRSLFLKIRMLAPKGTPRDEIVRVLQEAAETHTIPHGYEIRWMNWQKGEHGKVRHGEFAGAEVWDALTAFTGALLSAEQGTVRIAVAQARRGSRVSPARTVRDSESARVGRVSRRRHAKAAQPKRRRVARRRAAR